MSTSHTNWRRPNKKKGPNLGPPFLIMTRQGFEPWTYWLRVGKDSVSPVYRVLRCLPTPIYRGKSVQAVHSFYEVIRILHRNCTGGGGIARPIHQAETRKGDSNTHVKLGVSTVKNQILWQFDLVFQTHPYFFVDLYRFPRGNLSPVERDCQSRMLDSRKILETEHYFLEDLSTITLSHPRMKRPRGCFFRS
jgi:hypothetical protein